MDKPDTRRLEQAKKTLSRHLSGLSGIIGVGIGENAQHEPAIMVLLDSSNDTASKSIPESWEGFDVEIQLTSPPRIHGG